MMGEEGAQRAEHEGGYKRRRKTFSLAAGILPHRLPIHTLLPNPQRKQTPAKSLPVLSCLRTTTHGPSDLHNIVPAPPHSLPPSISPISHPSLEPSLSLHPLIFYLSHEQAVHVCYWKACIVRCEANRLAELELELGLGPRQRGHPLPLHKDVVIEPPQEIDGASWGP